MEDAIITSLKDLMYVENVNKEKLDKLISESLSPDFSKLVEWLISEMVQYTTIEERVSAITGPAEQENFLMELNGFLREYGGCVHSCLLEGPLNQRFVTKENKLLLLHFLTSELQALRIINVEQPHLLQKAPKPKADQPSAALLLKDLLVFLSFPKPPEGITFFQLFSKVENKIKDILSKVPTTHMSKPLLKATLSDKQWDCVNYINQAMQLEYDLRYTMMLDRLDVTVQSFLWADKQKEDRIKTAFNRFKEKFNWSFDISSSHILAAREDLLHIEKTSSGASRERTKCNINRHIIGKVPDRGGRAYEHDVPPPEMPSFQQRQQGGAAPRGRGGRDSNRGGGGDQVRRGGRESGGGYRGGSSGYNSGGSSSYSSSGGSGGHSGGQWGFNNQYDVQQQQSNATATAFFGGSGGASYYGNRQHDGGGGGNYYDRNQQNSSQYDGQQQGYQKGGQYYQHDDRMSGSRGRSRGGRGRGGEHY